MGLRKAETVIKAIKCGGNIEEWISEAEHQSSDHLEIKQREMKGDHEPHKKVITIIKSEIFIKFIQQFNEKNVDELCKIIKQVEAIRVIKDLELGYIELEIRNV
jgi:vacuolar-type H+-ATPase catalytic subunit A/Vma1